MSDLFDLSDHTAIVTGASSGLGSRFAEVLSDAGATARRLDRLDQLASDRPNIRPVRCDVADPDNCRALVD